jgi:rhodanese-related sulfurtransferase
MKTTLLLIIAAGLTTLPLRAQLSIVNTNIDMQGFLRISRAAAAHREQRRLSEVEFIRMSRALGTLVLDCRSRAMFDLLHIKGAKNLCFPDITVDNLARLIPDKSQRILIYCNNNFRNEPIAFASKIAPASLNLSTYISLYSYGYTNVYELGPLLDRQQTQIEFAGTSLAASDAAKSPLATPRAVP